ncbi:EF-hand domain-containing protein [Streptomyces sp. TRM72054]|uniref:EF-hand domain-containing protein n=1 Tax=Streptomyces sp. TRM72054 TaxID=2870562 RepID=UPI001C8CE47B|nr:EF-hand domain-containing protein [Streptomyces sp. TRM72054]MBX9399396.1 EF-hand domain-containing protein [Streptomyces sp. TRM72054]
MAESHYTHKMSARFDALDHDGDGTISQSDFDQAARTLITAFDQTPASPKGKALIDGAQHYWTRLAELADADQDGRITQPEFVAAATRHLRDNQQEYTRMVRPWVTAVLAVADVDDSQEVSADEWERMLAAMGMAPEAAHARASDIDTDNDGVISLDEALQSALRFYTTDEPLNPNAAAR